VEPDVRVLKRCSGFVTLTGHYLRQSHRPSITAKSIPPSWAKIKPGAAEGAMPANVSEIDRAMVTAGLAKDVEAVNQ
jgi:hypothetical protein